MRKRGLSGVVTTVLLILLVIVAIVIIWVIYRNFFNISVETGQFTARFDIIEKDVVIDNDVTDNNGRNVEFKVERKAGKGEVVGFNVVLEDENGNTYVEREDYPGGFNELEVRKIKILQGEHGLINNIVKISVAPVFLTDEGREFDSTILTTYEGEGGGVITNPTQKICGDNIKQTPNDDGLNEGCDGDSKACLVNGYSGTQSCLNDCSGYGSCTTTQYCGDGSIDGNEQCDQGNGNVATEDGCSGSCQVEIEWSCSGTPSQCIRIIPQDFEIHYKFDGNGNDETGGYSLICTPNCPAYSSTNKVLGQAASFNGIDDRLYSSVNFPSVATDGRSISVWFKSTLNIREPTLFMLGNAFDGSPNYGVFAITASNDDQGYLRFWQHSAVSTGQYQDVVTNCNTQDNHGCYDIPINQWQHLVVSYDNNNVLKIYINGAQIYADPEPSSRDLIVLDGLINIGARQGGGVSPWVDFYYNGVIDEMRIYNRGLNINEVKALCEEGESGAGVTCAT